MRNTKVITKRFCVYSINLTQKQTVQLPHLIYTIKVYLSNAAEPTVSTDSFVSTILVSGPCGAFCYLGHFKKLRIIIIIIIFIDVIFCI